MAQRRLIPSVRVDYIRVPGNEWMVDPEIRLLLQFFMKQIWPKPKEAELLPCVV